MQESGRETDLVRGKGVKRQFATEREAIVGPGPAHFEAIKKDMLARELGTGRRQLLETRQLRKGVSDAEKTPAIFFRPQRTRALLRCQAPHATKMNAVLEFDQDGDAFETEHQSTSPATREGSDPEDLSVLQQGRDKRLTLITCYPIYYIGRAPDRLVVFAKLNDDQDERPQDTAKKAAASTGAAAPPASRAQ